MKQVKKVKGGIASEVTVYCVYVLYVVESLNVNLTNHCHFLSFCVCRFI